MKMQTAILLSAGILALASGFHGTVASSGIVALASGTPGSTRKDLENSIAAFPNFLIKRVDKISLATSGIAQEIGEIFQLVKSELKEADEQLEAAKVEIKDLKVKNADQAYQLANANDMINAMRTEVKEFKKLIEGLKAKIENCEISNRPVNVDLANARRMIHNLQYEMESLKVNLAEANGKIKDLQKEVKSLKDQNNALKTENGNLSSDLAAKDNKLENANLKIDEFEETIRKMKIVIYLSRGGYEMVGGRFVKFYDTKMNWFDASKYCQNSNSRLITVEDYATTQWIIERHVPIWIGANDAREEGNWTWVGSNKSIVNGNWNWGEPSNGMGMWNENCAAANFNTFLWWSPGKWSDRDCNKEVRFACEIPDYHPAETVW